MSQLSNINFYNLTTEEVTSHNVRKVNDLVNALIKTGQISEKCACYLTTDINRTQQFYLLPNVHTSFVNPPVRQIVSGTGCPTEKISQLVDNFIKPLVPKMKSYTGDPSHILTILETIKVPNNCIIYTLDVTSLYTNIPHQEGIQAVSEQLAIHRTNLVKPSNLNIIKLIKIVLENSNFDFNGMHFQQRGGTAMGTKLAPSHANIFMSSFEDKHVYTYPLQPILWQRFTDELFLIWNQ